MIVPLSGSTPYFIYNPISGGASQAKRVSRVCEILGNKFPWWETYTPTDAKYLALQAASEGASAIVAVGGDGTVHGILNGIMELEPHVRPALGILPMGSANDFAFAAKIPHEPEAALQRIFHGRSSPVDVGSMQNKRGTLVYWLNTVGIGLNALVAIRARRFHAIKGSAKYVAGTLATLLEGNSMTEVDLTVDHHRFSEKITLLTLANGPREGGAFLMAPAARIDDGRLDMLMASALSRLSILRLLPGTRSGQHLRSRAMLLRQFSTLHVTSRDPLPIHTDGEIFATPADRVYEISVRIHPGAIRVLR